MGLTDSGVDGGGAFSLSSSSSNTMGLSNGPSIDNSSNIVGEKGVSMSGLNTASNSNCEFSQLNSISPKSDTWLVESRLKINKVIRKIDYVKKRRWLFFVVATRLSSKAMCSITAKEHKFLILKRKIFKIFSLCTFYIRRN